MRIGGTSIDSSARKTVTLWVDERTPENQQLHHEMIGGWEIIVTKSYEPSLSDTFYDIFTNTPILWILAGCVFIYIIGDSFRKIPWKEKGLGVRQAKFIWY
jgi:hypothetical protein